MKKILIADYDAKQSAHLKALLEKHGFEAKTVTNGEEALQIFLSWEPDAVVLEPMLPKLHGFEVSKKIKASARPDTALIWCTKTYKGKKYRDEAMYKYQASAFIERPAPDDAILNTIAKTLGVTLSVETPAAPHAVAEPIAAPPPPSADTMTVDRAALLKELARMSGETSPSPPPPSAPVSAALPAPEIVAEEAPFAPAVSSRTPHRKEDMDKVKQALKSTLKNLKQTPKKATASPYGLKKTVAAKWEQEENAPSPPPPDPAESGLLTADELFSDILTDTPPPASTEKREAESEAAPTEAFDFASDDVGAEEKFDAEAPDSQEDGDSLFTQSEDDDMEKEAPPAHRVVDVARDSQAPSLEALDAMEEAVEGSGLSDDLFTHDEASDMASDPEDLYATQKIESPLDEEGATLALDEILGKESAAREATEEDAVDFSGVPDAEAPEESSEEAAAPAAAFGDDEVNEDLLDTGAHMDAASFAPSPDEEALSLLDEEPAADSPPAARGDDSTLTVERDEFLDDLTKRSAAYAPALDEESPSLLLDEVAPSAELSSDAASVSEEENIFSPVSLPPQEQEREAREEETVPDSFELADEPPPPSTEEQDVSLGDDAGSPASASLASPGEDLSFAEDEEALETAHSVNLDVSIPSAARDEAPPREDDAPSSMSEIASATAKPVFADTPSAEEEAPRLKEDPRPAPARRTELEKTTAPTPRAETPPRPAPDTEKPATGGAWKIAAAVVVLALFAAGAFFMFLKKDSTADDVMPASAPPAATATQNAKAAVVHSTTPLVPEGIPVPSGTQVFVIVTVAPDGSVREARLAHNPSGNDAIAQAALREVRSWTFSPAFRDGKAVSDSLTVTVKFTDE